MANAHDPKLSNTLGVEDNVIDTDPDVQVDTNPVGEDYFGEDFPPDEVLDAVTGTDKGGD